ncbi:MAG: hypothetical protein RL141_276 [Candidatus Parcubacteria bacterium]|jgi:hypothetical protein
MEEKDREYDVGNTRILLKYFEHETGSTAAGLEMGTTSYRLPRYGEREAFLKAHPQAPTDLWPIPYGLATAGGAGCGDDPRERDLIPAGSYLLFVKS